MQKVARLLELPERRGTRVVVDGTAILLVRQEDRVFAYAAECPHAGGPLDEGAVCNGRLVCPWHKGTFRIADGGLLEPPPLDPLTRYPIRIEGEFVLVGTEALPRVAKLSEPDGRTMLILGAGAGGTAGAAALREAGFGGRIVMIGREPGTPYDRTSLSKFVMEGGMPPDEAPPLRDPAYFSEQRIELVHAEIIRLDAQAQQVHLVDGRVLDYDAALLAPGGVPKQLDVPGVALAGVHVLRSREDAAAILRSLRPDARIVVAGSGFIGMEVASGLRKQGLEVTVVTPEHLPFGRQFGPQSGGMFRRLHERHGVSFRFGAKIVALVGDGRVNGVELASGETLGAELVIAGMGIRPATDFVDGVARDAEGGIPVDAAMRAVKGLYVAGDVAVFPFAGQAIRVEHWRVAQQQARVAARGMFGEAAEYADVPFFWTYHYGRRFEYLGHAPEWTETIIDGQLDEQRFIALLVQEGVVVAAVACQREREMAVLSQRMRAPLPAQAALQVIRSATAS